MQQQLADSIDAVLRQLPADANTYRIRKEIAYLRGFVNRIRSQKTKPQTEGATDACVIAPTR